MTLKTQYPAPLHADMIIKVCGMRDPENIAEVAALSPMLMGFIFYDRSPRCARGLDPEVVKRLPEFIRPVALTVNASYEEITAICREYGFRIVQLHGDESPGLCRRLHHDGLVVFKAIAVSDDIDWDSVAAYEGAVDLFVFDRKTPARGGSGEKFSWQLLDSYPLTTPYLLSGGIGPDDIPAIVEAMRPGMAGIDINSRFESAPGVKDLPRLINFILNLRKFNEHEPSATPFWEKDR